MDAFATRLQVLPVVGGQVRPMTPELVGAFLIGILLVTVTVLAIHDQQNIAALKRQHIRLKKLEADHQHYLEAAYEAMNDPAWE